MGELQQQAEESRCTVIEEKYLNDNLHLNEDSSSRSSAPLRRPCLGHSFGDQSLWPRRRSMFMAFNCLSFICILFQLMAIVDKLVVHHKCRRIAV